MYKYIACLMSFKQSWRSVSTKDRQCGYLIRQTVVRMVHMKQYKEVQKPVRPAV